MKKLIFFCIPILAMTYASCTLNNGSVKKGTTDFQSTLIMSYNVENLFDTINDPENDEDFLPSGKLKWNTMKYREKLNHIAQVVNAVKTENGEAFPLVIGLIEVEHASCLNDLVALPSMKEGHYQVAFIEGEDERGIDVGLLYNAKAFKVKSISKVDIILPDNDKTRHILEVYGNWQGQEIAFYVNHWPSRSGGTEKSAPLRLIASETLEKTIHQRLRTNPNCKIVAMGDFNDYPTDISMVGLDSIDEFPMFNMMRALKEHSGSHYYKGEWGYLDQFIVSQSMAEPTEKGLKVQRAEAVNFDFMMYTNSKGEVSPARTYVGDSYKGGYSDHLPIVMEMKWMK